MRDIPERAKQNTWSVPAGDVSWLVIANHETSGRGVGKRGDART